MSENLCFSLVSVSRVRLLRIFVLGIRLLFVLVFKGSESRPESKSQRRTQRKVFNNPTP